MTVGKKGEIYTSKRLRTELGIKFKQKVKAHTEDGKLVIEPLPTLADVLRNPVFRITSKEAEKMSEEEQKKYGIR